MKFILKSASALILFGVLVSKVWTSVTSGTGGNDRSFNKAVKDDCWAKFPEVEGRDPKRWRQDAVGNIVGFTLRGCDGCLCHEYDHIVPFSKGGESVLNNCQLLQQRVNRYKGNEGNDFAKLKSYSCHREFSNQELNVVEMAIYGDVHDENGAIKCRCKSSLELGDSDPDFSSDEDEVCYEPASGADAEGSMVEIPDTKKERKKKRRNKYKKNKKAKEKRMRAESIDFGYDERSRPPIDSSKYPNCK